MDDIFQIALGDDDTTTSSSSQSQTNFNSGDFDTSNPYGQMFSDLKDQGLWGDQWGKPVGHGDVHIGSTYTPQPNYAQTQQQPAQTSSSSPTRTSSGTSDYTDLITKAATTTGVPEEYIKGLIDIESQGSATARSPKGAMGLMQVMPFHFKEGENGMDPATNIMRGAEILRDNYNHYGNWDSAAAAYFGAVDAQGNPTTASDGITTGVDYVRKFKDASAKYAQTPDTQTDTSSTGATTPAAPVEATVTYKDAYGNLFTVPKSKFDSRPGGNDDVTVVSTNKIVDPVQATAQDVKSGNVPNIQGLTQKQDAVYAGDQDVWALCGPVAAMAFAARNGRQPTPQEAKQLAVSVGWTPANGMAGPASEVALLTKMGVASHLETNIDWNKVAQDAQNGNPVIINTPGHYFVVEGYDPKTGKFDFGNSAKIWNNTGGNSWFKPEELPGLSGKYDLTPRGAIFMDNPASSTPSVVAGSNKPQTSTTTPQVTTQSQAPQQSIRADVGNRSVTLWDIAMGHYDLPAPIVRPTTPAPQPIQAQSQAQPAQTSKPGWLQQHQQQDTQARQQSAAGPNPDQKAITDEKTAVDTWTQAYQNWVKQSADIVNKNRQARLDYEANNAVNQAGQMQAEDLPSQDDLRPEDQPLPPPPAAPPTPHLDASVAQQNKQAQDAWTAQGGQGTAPTPTSPISATIQQTVAQAQSQLGTGDSTPAADQVLDALAPALNLATQPLQGPSINESMEGAGPAPQQGEDDGGPTTVSVTLSGQPIVFTTPEEIDAIPTASDYNPNVMGNARGVRGMPTGEEVANQQGMLTSFQKDSLKNQLTQRQATVTAERQAEQNPNALKPQSTMEQLSNIAQVVTPAGAAQTAIQVATGHADTESLARTGKGILASLGAGMMDIGKDVGAIAMGAGATDIGQRIYSASAQAGANAGLNSQNTSTLEGTVRGLAPMIPLTIAAVLSGGVAEFAAAPEEAAAIVNTGNSIANSLLFAVQGAGASYERIIRNGGTPTDATAGMVLAGALNAALAGHAAGEVIAGPMNYVADNMLPQLTRALAPALNTAAGKALVAAGSKVSPELVRNFIVEAGKMGAINIANIGTEGVFSHEDPMTIARNIASSTPEALLQGGVLGAAFHGLNTGGAHGTEAHTVESRGPLHGPEAPEDLVTNTKDIANRYVHDEDNVNTGTITNFPEQVLNQLPHQIPDISAVTDPEQRQQIMVTNMVEAERITGGLTPDQRADIFLEFDPQHTLTPEERTDIAERAWRVQQDSTSASPPQDIFAQQPVNPNARETPGVSTTRTGDQTILPGLENTFGEGPEQPPTKDPRLNQPSVGDTVEIKVGERQTPVRGNVVRFERDGRDNPVPIIRTESGNEIPATEWQQSGRILSTPEVRGETPRPVRAATQVMPGMEHLAGPEDHTSAQTLPFDAEPTTPIVTRREMPRADGTSGERPTLRRGATSEQKAPGISLPESRPINTPEVGDRMTYHSEITLPDGSTRTTPIQGTVVSIEPKWDGHVVVNTPILRTENGVRLAMLDWQVRGRFRDRPQEIPLGTPHTVTPSEGFTPHLPGTEVIPISDRLSVNERRAVDTLHQLDSMERMGVDVSQQREALLDSWKSDERGKSNVLSTYVKEHALSAPEMTEPRVGNTQSLGKDFEKAGKPNSGPTVDLNTTRGRQRNAQTDRAKERAARLSEKEQKVAAKEEEKTLLATPDHPEEEGEVTTGKLTGQPPQDRPVPISDISQEQADAIRAKQRADAGRKPRPPRAKVAPVTTEPRTLSHVPELRDSVRRVGGDKASAKFEKELAKFGDTPTNEQALQALDAVKHGTDFAQHVMGESSQDVQDNYTKMHPEQADAPPPKKSYARQAKGDDIPDFVRAALGERTNGQSNQQSNATRNSAGPARGGNEGARSRGTSPDRSGMPRTESSKSGQSVSLNTKTSSQRTKSPADSSYTFGNDYKIDRDTYVSGVGDHPYFAGYPESTKSPQNDVKIRELSQHPGMKKLGDVMSNLIEQLHTILPEGSFEKIPKFSGFSLDPTVKGYNDQGFIMMNPFSTERIRQDTNWVVGDQINQYPYNDPQWRAEYDHQTHAGSIIGTAAHEVAHSALEAQRMETETSTPHNEVHAELTRLINNSSEAKELLKQFSTDLRDPDIQDFLKKGENTSLEIAKTLKIKATTPDFGSPAQMVSPQGRQQRIQAPAGFNKRKFSRDAQQDLVKQADDIVKKNAQMPLDQLHQEVAKEIYGDGTKISLVKGNIAPHLSPIEMQSVLAHIRDQKTAIQTSSAAILKMAKPTAETIRDLALQGMKFRASVEQMKATKSNIKNASKQYTAAAIHVKETQDQFTKRILDFAQTQPDTAKMFVQGVNDASRLGVSSADMARSWDHLIQGKTTYGDWVGGLFYGGILGPGTAGKALIGNTGQVFFKIPMDLARTIVHHPGAVGAVTKMESVGLMHGFGNGIHAAANIIMKGFTDQVNGLENNVPLNRLHNNRTGLKPLDKTLNGLGYAVEGWDRLFVAADAFTRAIGFSMEKGRQAGLEAERQGDTSYANVKKIYDNPEAFMLKEAQRAGAETAFQGNPGDFGNILMKVQNWNALGRWAIPFVRTTYNGMQVGLERTPAGLLMAGVDLIRAENTSGKSMFTPQGFASKVRDANTNYHVRPIEERVWNSVVGTTIGIGLVEAMKSGKLQLTGAAPSTQKERDAWERDGKIPWGYKVGNGPMRSYLWAGDAAVGLAALAEGSKIPDKLTKGESIGNAYGSAVLNFGRGYTQMSVFSNLANILGAAQAGAPANDDVVKSQAARIAESTGQAFIPVGATGVAIGNAQDPNVRYPTANTFNKRVIQDIAARMPMYMPWGLPQRSDLQPALNMWGAPRANNNYSGGDAHDMKTWPGAAAQFFFPGIATGGAMPSQDPVDQELLRMYHATESTDALPARAPSSYQGHKFDDPDQKYEWDRRVGQNSYYIANRLMQSADYQNATDATKTRYLKAAYSEAENTAWESMDITDDTPDPNREAKYNGIKTQATQDNEPWWQLEKEADRAIVKQGQKTDAINHHREFEALTPRELQLANRYRGNTNPRYTQEMSKDRESVKKAIGTPADLPFVAVP